MEKDRKSDNEAFREVLVEEARALAGVHPGVDSLVDYLGGVLDSEEDERVRDHLVACAECAGTVLDLDPLMKPEVQARDGVVDLEVESAWRALQSELDAPDRGRSSTASRWPMALAASLMIATLALSAWVTQLLRSTSELRQQVAQLSQPLVNPPILYLDGVTRNQRTGAVVEFSPEKPFVLLIAIPGTSERFASYEAVLNDASGGVVWRGSGLGLSVEDTLRIQLPRDLLPEGEYTVRIEGIREEPARPENELLIESSLRVVHKPPV